MKESEDEGHLLGRIRNGDAAAFRVLVDAYADRLHNFAARMLKNESLAEDIVQETFLKVWTKPGEFRGESKLGTYLFRITSHACLDHLKSAGARRYGGEFDEEVAEPSSVRPDTLLGEKHRQLALEAALDALPERQRAALLLKTQEALSQKEIASALGESEESVESLLARARQNLKRTLGVSP